MDSANDNHAPQQLVQPWKAVADFEESNKSTTESSIVTEYPDPAVRFYVGTNGACETADGYGA